MTLGTPGRGWQLGSFVQLLQRNVKIGFRHDPGVEKANDSSCKVFGVYADAGMTAIDTCLIENALQDFKLLRFEDATLRRCSEA